MNQFKTLAESTMKIIRKEELILDFGGYVDFIEKYKDHHSYDTETINEIIKESIAWNDYFSELQNYINILISKYDLLLEITNVNSSSKKEKDDIKEKIAMLKLFKKEITLQKKYCLNVYYKVIKEWEKGMKILSPNDYIGM